MPLTPRAPPYEIGETQQRYQADHHHDRPPRSRTFRKETQPPAARGERSRSRSRSRDRRSSSSSRSINLLGLAVVIVLSVSFLSSFRHRREGIDGADGGDIAAAGEARLRREVQGLEDTLRRKKKALLGGGGVAAGLPPEGLSAVVGDGGGGGGGGSTLRGGGRDWPSKQHATRVELEGRSRGSGDGYRTRPLPAPESPPIPPASLAGDPLYGPGSTPPLRQSLESQPGLIREPVPLIVGGTDGSGTRGVVALLQRLKVPMVVEDKGTMDVHGAPYMVKGGWPEVVRPVIAWAGGTGYESRAAPAGLRGKTFEALGNLRVQMQELAGRLRSPSRGEEAARHVSWGFKAPVSMVLVPFFEEAWGKAKFLHVVRDGRDIAFSGNQTPVEKFYADMFPEGSRELGLQEPSLKGIALWDRWNVGVYEWAASRKEKGAPGMDYLLLHAEDLIDPAAKFAAIKDVAEFVGSPLSDSELCCIATEGSKDMGSHTASRKDRGQITSRFGKWKGKVDGNPQLSKLLHHEGERGLRLFGYEPERSLRASSGFQCAAERDPTCPSGAAFPSGVGSPPRTKRAQPNVKVPAHVSIDDTDVCVGLKKEIDFQGFDVKAGHFEDHLGCCRECRKVLDCSFFTFDYNSGVCYLKSGKGAENPKLGLVSGMAQQAVMS